MDALAGAGRERETTDLAGCERLVQVEHLQPGGERIARVEAIS